MIKIFVLYLHILHKMPCSCLLVTENIARDLIWVPREHISTKNIIKQKLVTITSGQLLSYHYSFDRWLCF